jgi:exodeoxyribonuclease VII small subunit
VTPPKAAKAVKAAKDGDGRPALPYEQARDQLTELVKRLEAGGLTLEQSLELWERGEQLADICQQWLEGARARLTAATAQACDEPGDPAAPF